MERAAHIRTSSASVATTTGSMRPLALAARHTTHHGPAGDGAQHLARHGLTVAAQE